jgi:hypothetical protein
VQSDETHPNLRLLADCLPSEHHHHWVLVESIDEVVLGRYCELFRKLYEEGLVGKWDSKDGCQIQTTQQLSNQDNCESCEIQTVKTGV